MERCNGCGLEIFGGTTGCQALFDQFRIREPQELAPDYRSTRLSIDVYCLQHPERYCVSAKSLAAHLTGVCWAVEREGSMGGLQILQRWLNAPGQLTKPALPQSRGRLTIADLAVATGPQDYGERLQRWAASTWAAYSPLHQVARAWVDAALSRTESRSSA
jgi:hypothetical protein